MAIRWLMCVIPAVVPPCLAAQTLGLPLSYRPVMSGFGAAIDAGGDKGGFRTTAITGIVALGHVTAEGTQMPLFNVSGTVAHLSGEGGAAGGADVGAELSLLGSFAVGVDRSRWAGVTRIYVPLAAALPLVGCANAKRILLFYGVPLWSFERLEQPTGAKWQPSWGSVNLGALLELHSGLGFQLGVGGLFQRATPDPYRRVVIGAGVHFSPHGILQAAAAEQGGGGCGFGL
jgi:hypothetical protein